MWYSNNYLYLRMSEAYNKKLFIGLWKNVFLKENNMKKKVSILLAFAMLLGLLAPMTQVLRADDKLDYKNLDDGMYEVGFEMAHYYEKGKLSMSDSSVVRPAYVVVEDGKYYLQLEMQPVNREWGAGKKLKGYLGTMKYQDENGDFKDVEVLSTYDDKDDFYDVYVKHVNTKNPKYPKVVKYPIEKPSEIKQTTAAEVFVPVMESLMTGAGTKKCKPTILWNEIKKVEGKKEDKKEDKTDKNDKPDNSEEETEIKITEGMSKWAIEGVNKAINNYLVPEDLQNKFKENITRKDFAQLVTSCISSILEQDIDDVVMEKTGKSLDDIVANEAFVDTADRNILAAKSLGIINGVGGNKFAPNNEITRQDAAVLLTRIAKLVGKSEGTNDLTFADKDSIKKYAKKSVAFVSKNDIMKGVGKNMFSPKSTYTRQQAYVTIYRLFELCK